MPRCETYFENKFNAVLPGFLWNVFSKVNLIDNEHCFEKCLYLQILFKFDKYMLLQFLINGLITGSIYALAALGFALVYNTTRIFHLAYAAVYMFAPYMLFTFYVTMGIPFVLSFIISVLLTMFLSVSFEFSVYKPLSKNKSSGEVILISSLGIMIIVINVIAMFYGNETKIIVSSISNSISFGNIIITYNQLWQFSVSVILLVVFFVLLGKSKFGQKARALRDDTELFMVMGYNVYGMRTLLFLLSGLFVAVSSNLVAFDVGMDPYVGLPMLLNALVALIISGVGKFEAPVLGGFIIGLLQALTVFAFSAQWQNAITFLLMILFLVFRPQGLLGEKQRAV